MTPLKKFIRPGVLRNLLRKALDLSDGTCPFAILYEGETVLVEGAESMDGFGLSDPGVLAQPVIFDSIHQGHVCLRHPVDSDPQAVDGYRRILKFATYSIQELIDMERARRSIADEALAKYRELALLHRAVPVFNTSLQLREVVSSLINECRRENYPGELGMIFLLEPETGAFRLAMQFGFTFGANPQAMAETELFVRVAETGKGEIINDLTGEARWHNELPGLGAMALIPIASPYRTEGMLILASENKGLFEAAHRKSLSTLASIAGISVSNAFNFEGIQTLMNALLQALAEAIDSRDPYTAGHSERVAHLGVAFAFLLGKSPDFKHLDFSDHDLRELYYSGILHDVGKIGIKEDVLTKKTRLPRRRMDVLRARLQLYSQGGGEVDWVEAYEVLREVNRTMTPDTGLLDMVRKLGQEQWRVGDDIHPLLYDDELEVLLLDYGNLTRDERKEIQRHPAESERILQHIPLQEGYANMLTIIRQHHERMDGSGYPDGLKGDEILLQSRLLAIVDIYDAVTQERHYKPASTRSEAMKILLLEVEQGRLDAELVGFFLNNIEQIESISERVKTTRISHLSEIGSLTPF